MQNNSAWILTRILLLIAICQVVNACGTKGPLYIPEQQYPQETPAKS